MFNRGGTSQVSEARVADIERVITQHGEMLNALKDHLIGNMDEIAAIFSALSTAIATLPDEQQKVLSNVLAGLVRDAADQDQAKRMRTIFEERLLLTIPAVEL